MVGFDLNLQVVTVQRLWNTLSPGWSCSQLPIFVPSSHQAEWHLWGPVQRAVTVKTIVALERTSHPSFSTACQSDSGECGDGKSAGQSGVVDWLVCSVCFNLKYGNVCAPSWFYATDLCKQRCKLFRFCCVLLCCGLFLSTLFNIIYYVNKSPVWCIDCMKVHLQNNTMAIIW